MLTQANDMVSGFTMQGEEERRMGFGTLQALVVRGLMSTFVWTGLASEFTISEGVWAHHMPKISLSDMTLSRWVC